MQRSSVIVLDSDDDDVCYISPVKTGSTNGNDSMEKKEENDEPSTSRARTSSPKRRIQPQLISREVRAGCSNKRAFGTSPEEKKRRKSKNGFFKRNRLIKLSDVLGISDDEDDKAITVEPEIVNCTGQSATDHNGSTKPGKKSFTKEFRALIQTCRAIDTTVDMEKLIRRKLIAYYLEVPPDFVTSKSFCTLVSSVTEEIKKGPHLIYLKITRIIEELKPRRYNASKSYKPSNSKDGAEGTTSAPTEQVNTKKDQQIRKLNKALVALKRRIDELDQEEVDFEEDINSSHMKVERYKKRACQIYEKICDLSGESKHAQRSTRKPIKFNGTSYPEFNKTLQAFVNRTNIFPDYFDVKKCLEHCNKQYDLKLRSEDIKTLAQDAFVQVGKLLQKRRKLDLYEMVSYFVGTDKDPADEDHDLQEKLVHNKQYHHSKINDVIDKFAKNDQSDDEDMFQDPMTMCKTELDSEEVNQFPEESPAEMIIKEEIKPETVEDVGVVQSNGDLDTNLSSELQEPNVMMLADTEAMNEAIEFIVSNNLDPFDAVPEVDSMLMMSTTDDGLSFDL